MLCCILPNFVSAADNPFLPAGASDEGWPSLRGPTFDGHSREVHIADNWPPEGPPVLWTRELGQGYSAIIAVGDRVYTQGQTLSGQYVYCLKSETGETHWTYQIDWPYEGIGVYPGPRSTPTYDAGKLYVTAPNGVIVCLNAETGKRIWSRNVLREYAGTGGEGFGYSCSPVVIDGMVILPVGGASASMVALDQDTGLEVWSEGNSPGSYASAYPIEHHGRKLIVGYLQNSLVIHDRMTGELLHETNLSTGYDEHSCWPIYQEPYLWTAGPFRAGSKLYRLPESFDGQQPLEVVWQSKLLSNDVVSSVLIDGHLYGFDIFDVQAKTQRPSRGMFRCVDFLSGEEKWSQGTGRPRRGGSKDDPNEIGQSGLIAVDGKIIVFNERGELILLLANSEEIKVLARSQVLGGELTWTPPTLHRGRLYVRDHSRAVCLYLGEPELLKTKQPPLQVADVPRSQYLDLAKALLPVEPEYMFDVPSPRWMWNWYLAGIVILASSGLSAFLIALFTGKAESQIVVNSIYGSTAFLLGALGTTLLSDYFQEFYFTWPVCLYISFECVISRLRKRSESINWKERSFDWLAVLGCVLVSVCYFLLCRRLSLVFEWAFLMGYAGGVPPLLFKNKFEGNSLWVKFGCNLLAFSGFYLVGVLPLMFGY